MVSNQERERHLESIYRGVKPTGKPEYLPTVTRNVPEGHVHLKLRQLSDTGFERPSRSNGARRK